MKTYLLAWNPNRWEWNNIAEISENVKQGKDVFDRWSSGVSRKLQAGDRFFLIRLGKDPKGILASGTIETNVYQDLHWDKEKAANGQSTNHVKIKYDLLLNPDTEPILPRELLNQPPFSKMHWDTQMSGVQIPDHIASELEALWTEFKNSLQFSFPEEVEINQENLFEGAVRRVSVNAYERNLEARKICINYYGAICKICNFNFETTYGEIGKGFIHVHHLKQISEIGETYRIDPITDLIPVCPNCHAIIHKRNPPYTIEEVRDFLRI